MITVDILKKGIGWYVTGSNRPKILTETVNSVAKNTQKCGICLNLYNYFRF